MGLASCGGGSKNNDKTDAPNSGDGGGSGTAEAIFSATRVTTLAGASQNAGAAGTFTASDLQPGSAGAPALSNTIVSAIPGTPPKVIFVGQPTAFDAVDVAVEGQSGYFEIPAGNNNTLIGLDLVTQAAVPNATLLTLDIATRTGTTFSAVTQMQLFVSLHQFIAAGDLQNHDTCASDVADLFGAVLEGNQGSPAMPSQVITNHDNNTDINDGIKGDVGPVATGHREVVWDGVPEKLRNASDFSEQFFNRQAGGSAGVQGGSIFEPIGGSGIEVNDALDGVIPNSATVGPPGNPNAPFGGDFSNINPAFEGDFLSFTQDAAFAPLGTNQFQITFDVAASSTQGFVVGAGIVFVSVDVAEASSVEFFDVNGVSLNKTVVPPRSAGPFPIPGPIAGQPNNIPYSFAGWIDHTKQVAKVIVTNGQIPIDQAGSNGNDHTGTPDVVVVDDIYYAEPNPAQ